MRQESKNFFNPVRRTIGKIPASTAESGTTFNNATSSDTIVEANTSVAVWGLILLSASLYVMAALIMHRVEKVRTRKREVFDASGSVRIKKASGFSPRLDNVSLIASVLTFLNCVSNLPLLFTNDVPKEACQVVQLLSYIFYSSGHVCVYLFLWMRQRTCYKNPTLALTLSKVSRVVSTVIMPVFVSTNLAGVVLTAVLWDFNTNTRGCVETEKSKIPLIVLFAGSTVMQCTLLILFIYPLKRHTSLLMERSAISSSDKLLANLVKRSIVSTVLCVLADTSSFICAMCLDSSLPSIFTNFIYDANLICNVICVIGSFADWRRRLGPCCAHKKACDKRYTSSVKSSSATTV